MNGYYRDSKMDQVKIIKRAIKEITKVDHLRIERFLPGNYSVRDCITEALETPLESLHTSSEREYENFKRAV